MVHNLLVCIFVSLHFETQSTMLDQPSIQSFYDRLGQQSSARAPPSLPLAGDGFASQELDLTKPASSSFSWSPKGHYAAKDIDSIMPGPGCVKIVGRIVNLSKKPWSSSHSQGLKASGHVKMVVRDDTGIIVVLSSFGPGTRAK